MRMQPSFLETFYCHNWKPRMQTIFIGIAAGLDVLMTVVFAGLLNWI
jgi:hypothetical protein